MSLLRATLALVFACLCFATNQTAAQTTAAKPIVVSGSSTVFPLMTDIARRFEALNPGTAVEVRSGGTGKGLTELRSDQADIAMASRPLLENEKDLFAFTLCRDGAAIVVHRTNPIRALDRRQLSNILTGTVTDWKQLGGHPGAIRLAWRSEGQAIPELLLQQLKLKPEQIRSTAIYFENADAVKFAASDRNAITVAALGVAERGLKRGMPVKLLAYEGVQASTRAVRDRTYALSRPLLLVTRSVPEGSVKRLIDYAVSPAVIDLHEKHGFVPYQDSARGFSAPSASAARRPSIS